MIRQNRRFVFFFFLLSATRTRDGRGGEVCSANEIEMSDCVIATDPRVYRHPILRRDDSSKSVFTL